LPPPKGILVGLDETARYQAASVTLNRGDALVLYTDGVTEAMNAERELFTLERLLVCLRASPTTLAPALADHIKRTVRNFAGEAPPSDDLTMVIVRFLGAPEGDPA
jgi:sigma-B regulation protein RsbU (phosphoserine phosphatase)